MFQSCCFSSSRGRIIGSIGATALHLSFPTVTASYNNDKIMFQAAVSAATAVASSRAAATVAAAAVSKPVRLAATAGLVIYSY